MTIPVGGSPINVPPVVPVEPAGQDATTIIIRPDGLTIKETHRKTDRSKVVYIELPKSGTVEVIP